jgi:ribosome recycling factor
MASNILSAVEKKMKAVSEGFRQELSTIRTGRASPGLVEHIKVDYAGVPTPLNQIAGISAPESRLLVIQPWDPGSLHAIVLAIQKSDLGLKDRKSVV